MIKRITSTDNDEIKYLKKIITKSSFRQKEKLFVMEGKRAIFDIDSALIDKIYISETEYEKVKLNLTDNKKIVILSDRILDKISATEKSQGYLALVKSRGADIDEILPKTNRVIILDRIADPGNFGTIIRTAEAAGIGLVIAINCVDKYNPKVVRSTMGAITRQNIWVCDDVCKIVQKIKKYKFNIYASTLDNSKNYDSVEYSEKTALILGSEAHGIRKELIEAADYNISIPMGGKIESLNVSVAAGILMYELCRNKV